MALRAHQLSLCSSTKEDALGDGRVFRAFESFGMDRGGRVDLFWTLVAVPAFLNALKWTEEDALICSV